MGRVRGRMRLLCYSITALNHNQKLEGGKSSKYHLEKCLATVLVVVRWPQEADV